MDELTKINENTYEYTEDGKSYIITIYDHEIEYEAVLSIPAHPVFGDTEQEAVEKAISQWKGETEDEDEEDDLDDIELDDIL